MRFPALTLGLIVAIPLALSCGSGDGGGGPSPNPAPVLTGLTRDTATAGTPGLTVGALGDSFTSGSVVQWNGVGRPTTFVNAGRVDFTLDAAALAAPDTAQVTVFTGEPGGGTSAARSFVILSPPAVPAITGTVPDSVMVGPGPIPFIIQGTGLAGADSVRYSYQGDEFGLAPGTVTDTTVEFDLPRDGLASIGALSFSVHAPGGWSNARLVETYDPTPVITGFAPDTLDGSATADTFDVIGTGFVAGMVVRVQGLDVASSTVISYDTIRVVVTEGALLLGGSPAVTVVDTWDDRTSAPLPIGILSPAPNVDSIVPGTGLAGVTTEYALYGAGFRGLGEVLVNGVARPLTFFSTDMVTFQVDSAEVPAGGAYSVAFRTPAPGGGTSNAVTLQLVTPNPVPVTDSVTPEAVRSDSGTQFVTFFGHGFIPGTTAELHSGPFDTDPVDTLQILSGDSTSATFQLPDAVLQAGRLLSLTLQAPAPTTGPSPAVVLPVWTTGVRRVVELPGPEPSSWASDTARDLMYGAMKDPAAANEPTTLVALDPSTGEVLKSLALPDHGARLFFGGASKYLYAICAGGVKICRIDLDAWTLDWAIDGFTVNGEATTPVFIAPEDAYPGTFVLAVNVTGNEYANWSRTYDGTVPRAAIDTFSSGVHSGAFFGDTLVLMNGYNVYRRTIAPGAQSSLDSVGLALNVGVPARILSSTRAIADGHLLDLSTGGDLGSHPGFLTSGISTGPVAGRFFTATSTEPVPTLHLYAFDLTTGAELRHVALNGAYPRSFGISPAGLPFLGYTWLGTRIVESVISDP